MHLKNPLINSLRGYQTPPPFPPPPPLGRFHGGLLVDRRRPVLRETRRPPKIADGPCMAGPCGPPKGLFPLGLMSRLTSVGTHEML